MIATTAMIATDDALFIAEKMQAAEKAIAQNRGGFYLFGLFERETPGHWDLVVSAPWLKTDYAGTDEIITLLREEMNLEDWKVISAVFPLEPSADYIQWFTRHYHLEHELEETYNAIFNGVPVSRAFLITSNSSPAPARVAAEPVAA